MCLCLERALGERPYVLYLACGHHILEFVLPVVFSFFVGRVSQGPNITIFTAFGEYWPRVDKSKFLTALEDDPMAGVVALWAEEVVGQAQSLLKKDHPAVTTRNSFS